MKAALVVVVGIVDVAVVLALVRLVVVVAVEAVYVVVGLDVVHQEGLFVVGKQVEVAVDLGGAVVVLVLAQEDSVYVVGLGVVEKAGQVADPAVGVAVPVIVVVHQLPVDGAVGQPGKVGQPHVVVPGQVVAHLGAEPRVDRKELAPHPGAAEPARRIEEVGRTAVAEARSRIQLGNPLGLSGIARVEARARVLAVDFEAGQAQVHVGAVDELPRVFPEFHPHPSLVGQVLHVAARLQHRGVVGADVLGMIGIGARVEGVQEGHLHPVIVGEQGFHLHRFHLGLPGQIEEKCQLLFPVGAKDILRRFHRKGREQPVQVGVAAHVDGGLMVKAVEVVGEEWNLAVPVVGVALEARVTGGLDVVGGAEFSRCPRKPPNLRSNTPVVPHRLRPQVVSDLAVDDEAHLLDHGPAHAILGRIVGKAHHDPVYQGLVRAQPSLEAVAGICALVEVVVDPVQAEVQNTQIDLQPAARQQGGVVGQIELVVEEPASGRDGVEVGVGPLDPRPQDGEFEVGSGYVHPHAVEIGLGQGQGREAGDQRVSHHGGVAPAAISVAGEHYIVENRHPGAAGVVLKAHVLENGAAPLLLRDAGFQPFIEGIAGDKVVAHGVVVCPRSDVEGLGVVGILGKILEGEIAVSPPLGAQEQVRGGKDLGRPKVGGTFLGLEDRGEQGNGQQDVSRDGW